MFKKNSRHLQIPLTSHVDELPEVLRKRLHNSWAETFYRKFFCRLDEKPFDALYVDFPSRPDVPVNVLVGLEFLKSANGWTDEELYDHYCYDVQVCKRRAAIWKDKKFLTRMARMQRISRKIRVICPISVTSYPQGIRVLLFTLGLHMSQPFWTQKNADSADKRRKNPCLSA